MVADLVTEMPDQRAIRLVHLRAARLAFGIVGFGDVERDLTLVVTGQHFRAGILGEELEDDAVRGVFRPALYRQTEPQQIVDQAMFGALDLPPQNEIAGLIEIGNDAVPIAGKLLPIGAIARASLRYHRHLMRVER